MLGRLKFNIEPWVEAMLDQVSPDVWSDSRTQFIDPALGGGQFVASIERRLRDFGWSENDIANRVSGFENNQMRINYAKNKYSLVGDYTAENFIEKDISMIENVVVVGNPPYNDGSAGRAPIYDKFLEKLVQINPEKVCFIIPTNWFSQNHNKLGKSVRSSLKTLGVYKIVLNPVTLFSGVTVGTCTVFCVKDYAGKVELENGETGEIIEINNFDEQILTEFNPISLGLLNRLKPFSPPVTYGGTDKADKWRIMTSYRKERFDLEPLNILKVIEPNYKSQGGYRMFTYFDTEDQALEYVEYYRSFWHSKLIKFIMRRTRTSTTLDNPQLRWVPVPKKIDHVFTDEELYLIFNLTQEEIEVVEDDARKYN